MATASADSTPLRRLLGILAPDRTEIVAVYVYAALSGVLGLAVPLGVQAIIGLVSGGMLLQPVVLLIAFVVGATLAAGLIQVMQLGVVERLQQRIFARFALDAGHRVARADLEALAGTNLPELTNRFFEVIAIQKSVAKLLTDAVAALLSIAAGLVLLTFYHPYLSLFGVVLLGVLAVLLWVTGRTGLTTSLKESSAKYRVAHWLQEIARHAGAFRLAGASALPIARMDRDVDDYLCQRDAHFRVLARQSVAVVVTKTIITGGLLVIGTSLVVNRSITLGQFVASELVIVTLLAGVEKLILSLGTVYDALTAAEKSAALSELPTVAPTTGRTGLALPTAEPRGLAVEARGVSYRYRDNPEPALHDVTLSVRPGERIAIVSSEGAGASTLLRVLAGLMPSYGGELALSGVSLRDAQPEAVRDRVALVPPTIELIDGTIADNIAMGRAGVDAEAVDRAVARVGLSEHVRGFPHGLQTLVGGAHRLTSQLERKVALARAIVTRPSLLLLDEFFHNLEPQLKRRMLGRLLGRDAGWTLIAASHDPLYLAACDRVVLLADGGVRREGTYDALLGDSEFHALVLAQTARLYGEDVTDTPAAAVAAGDRR